MLLEFTIRVEGNVRLLFFGPSLVHSYHRYTSPVPMLIEDAYFHVCNDEIHTEYGDKLRQQLAEDERSRLVGSVIHVCVRVGWSICIWTTLIQIDDCLCQAESYAKDAFSIIIDQEMKSVYGELWYVH